MPCSVRDVEGLDAVRRDRAGRSRARAARRRAPPRRPSRRNRTRWRSRALVSASAHALGGGAPLRIADGDLRAAARGRRNSSSRSGSAIGDGQVDLVGQERIGVVELGQKRLEERGRVDLLRLLEEELPPVLQHAAAHDEDADRDVSARLEEAEDVDVLALHRLDDLALATRPPPSAARRGTPPAISKLSRFGGAPASSPRGSPASSRLRPWRNSTTSAHGLVVRLLRRQARDAGPEAGVEVVVEAGPRQLAVDLDRAGADLEVARDHAHDAPGQAAPERAEVGVAVLLHPPRHQRPRPRLSRRDLDVGVGLVVPQADVVPGPVLLDEGVLEEQGLQLGVGDDRLDLAMERGAGPPSLSSSGRLRRSRRPPAFRATAPCRRRESCPVSPRKR